MTELGNKVGHIRLVGVLGKGGMGTVYIGLDEKLNRQVAVKAINAQRIGPSARASLLREAQVLSRLDHPNICRIYGFIEGDDTDYLILERIRGRNLREVLDEGADTALRLRIAEQTARALEAAHQKGVVHRDLKPRNVILSEDGIAKVLDFGLARRIDDPKLAERSTNLLSLRDEPGSDDSTITVTWHGKDANTAVGEEGLSGPTTAGAIIGTAAYMSPEQARGETTTAASDVYSLGLLLQEMFTGRRPYDSELNLHELLKTAAAGGSHAVTGVDAELGALLSSMKSMAPEARPTASEVVARLRRIRGRPRRLALRLAVATIALLVVGGFLKYTFDLRHEREAAEAARYEAEQVAAFMVDVFQIVEPEQARGSTVTARELLDRGADRVREALADQPRVQTRLMLTIGRVYRRLGFFDQALSLIEEALEHRRAVLGDDHPDVAHCLVAAADVYATQGRYEIAESAASRALTIYEAEFGPRHPETAFSMALLGTIYLRLGRFDDAEQMFVRNLAVLEANPDRDPQGLADTLANLATLYRQRDDIDAAEESSRRALEIRQQSMPPDHPDLALSYNNLAVLLYVQGRFGESAEQLESALRIWEKTLGLNHPHVATSVNNLAELAWKQGDYTKSEALFLRALAIWEDTVGVDHPDTAFAVHGLANLYRDTGRYDEAVVGYRRAVAIREKALVADHPDFVATREDLEVLYRLIGESDGNGVAGPQQEE